VWMWERGRSKRNWMAAVQGIYSEQLAEQQVNSAGPQRPIQPDDHSPLFKKLPRFLAVLRGATPLEKVPLMGTLDWVGLVFTAFALIAIPLILAYLTSYYTPVIGLSCRTFTFILYFIFQAWLSALWLFDFRFAEQTPLLNEAGWPTPFGVATVLGFAGAAFTAITGTFLQLLGVFRNCKCSIPMANWADGRFRYVVSTNTPDMIYYAKQYWMPTGVASIVILLVFCYLGWMYQRRWRNRFLNAARDVLGTR